MPAPAGASHADVPSTPTFLTAPPGTVPVGEKGVTGERTVKGGGLWSGGTLQAATRLSVPIALGALVLVFVVVQWLVDWRDPKFVEAPARKEDDSVGFD